MLRAVCVLWIMLNASIAIAQQVETKSIVKYTQAQGLSSYNVRKILQDKYGFMWIATQGGLSRFDGQSFINYTSNASAKHRLCAADVRELIEDPKRNLLWVLCNHIGINAINTTTGTVVLTIPIPYATPEDWNISMVLHENRIWIGTSTGVKVYNLSDKKFEASLLLPKEPVALAEFEVRTLIRDDYGNMWACFSGFGIVIYNGKTKEIIKEIPIALLNDHRGSNNIMFLNAITCDNESIVFATTQGLRKVSYSKLYEISLNNQPCNALPSLNTESIRCIYRSKSKDVLVASATKLYRFNSTLTQYKAWEEQTRFIETDWLSAVQCLYEDRKSNWWLGCQEGVAFVAAQRSPFTIYNYDKRTNTKLDHVWCLYPLPNHDLLVGLRHGLIHINHKTGAHTSYDTRYEYYHIFSDYNGLLHVSRSDGLYIYRSAKFHPVSKFYPEFVPFSRVVINSHLFINDSLVVLGTETKDGILVWNTKKHTIVKIGQAARSNLNSSLASGIVNTVYQDSKKNIWVLSDNLITVLTEDLQKRKEIYLRDPATRHHYTLFFDMCEAKGSYWIASYGFGLVQLDADYNIKAVFNSAKGLSSDEVYQVFHTSEAQLLITSNNGLSVLNLNTLRFKNYYKRDGLHADSFEEACGLIHNGLVYAGGINGFTVINPKYIFTNTVRPKLYVNRVEIKASGSITDTSNLGLRQITIPSNALQTTIYLTGLNYLNPERTTFAYRIKENKSDWVDLGKQNLIQLIGIGPGTYSLQVKAANEDGMWSVPVDLQLIFLPKWYQTWWFKAALFFTGSVILYGLYRIRIQQITREQAIRAQLASDLHDDLGSTLNSVKVYTNLALLEKGEAVHLQKIKESTQEAIHSVHDIIWVLDDRVNNGDDLVLRINKFVLPLCKAKAIQYHQKISEEALVYQFGSEEKRNLYMIVKEAVNNSIKYADASEIQFHFFLHRGKPVIIVKDSGVGFEAALATFGNGLSNMKQRAGQIGYAIGIDATAGTTIELRKK